MLRERVSYVFTPKHKRNHKQNDWAQENQFCFINFPSELRCSLFIVSLKFNNAKYTEWLKEWAEKAHDLLKLLRVQAVSQMMWQRKTRNRSQLHAKILRRVISVSKTLKFRAMFLHQNISGDIKKMIFYTKNQSSYSFL